MWRTYGLSDDESIVRMCLALYAEDPGPRPVPAANIRQTLSTLRKESQRGCAVVLEIEGHVGGYSLLIPYWSNELGGEICSIDEIYVEPPLRGHGHATRLVEDLASGTSVWARDVVALMLEVTPDNVRARRLYERLGFRACNLGLRRLLA